MISREWIDKHHDATRGYSKIKSPLFIPRAQDVFFGGCPFCRYFFQMLGTEISLEGKTPIIPPGRRFRMATQSEFVADHRHYPARLRGCVADLVRTTTKATR